MMGKYPLSRSLLFTVILAVVLMFKGYVTFTGGGICFGELCKRYTLVRTYMEDASQFKVQGPYVIEGRKHQAVHTYKLGPEQSLKGTSYGYDIATNNDQGQDAKLHYLTPDKVEAYMNQFVIPGKDCPSAWMHQNLRIYMLVGANNQITKRLEDYKFQIEYGGTPFAYRGRFMTYDSSTLDGEGANLVPAQFEHAYSNVGYAETPWEYFLVTGFETPDLNPRTPASNY